MRLIFETVIVFVAAALPIVLLNGGLGILISAGILYYYLKKWGNSASSAAAASEPDPDFAKFRFFRGLASILAFVGLSLLPITAWLLWAFPTLAELVRPDGATWLSVDGVIWAMAGMLMASLLFAWMAVASLRWPGESMGQCYHRVLAGRLWETVRPVVMNFALYQAMMGIIALYSALPGMIRLLETTTPNSRLSGALEMAIAMPAVPIWLYASIVLIAFFKRLAYEDLIAGQNGQGSSAMHRSTPAISCFAVSASAAVVLVALANVMHLAVFGVLGPVGQVRPITAVVTEVEDWVAAQRESGRPVREIVGEFQFRGRWTPDSPNSGLVDLIPALKTGKSYGSINESTCTFSIEARVADLNEFRSIDWLPEDEATQPVAYCLSVDCPSPTRWPQDSTLSLYSSHSSQNRYWMANRFLDIFGWGASEPGGYCTTTGSVSGYFQG